MTMPISLTTPFKPEAPTDKPSDQSDSPGGVDFNAFLFVPAAPPSQAENDTTATNSDAPDSGAGQQTTSSIRPEFGFTPSKSGSQTSDSPILPAPTRLKGYVETEMVSQASKFSGPGSASENGPFANADSPGQGLWAGTQMENADSIKISQAIKEARQVSGSKHDPASLFEFDLPEAMTDSQSNTFWNGERLASDLAEVSRSGGTISVTELPQARNTDRERAQFSLPRISSILEQTSASSDADSQPSEATAQASEFESQFERTLEQPTFHDRPASNHSSEAESIFSGTAQIPGEAASLGSDPAPPVELFRSVPRGTTTGILEQIEPRVLEIVRNIEPGEEKNSLKMRLSPAELGSVEITIVRNDDGAMTARFMTESETAQNALNENLVHLRESLEASGVQVESIEIGYGSFSSDSQQSRQGSGVRTEQYSSETAATTASPNEEPGGEDRLVDLRA